MAPAGVNVIEYVTIASTGDAQDFGDLTVARGELGSACSSTRGIWLAGRTNSPSPGTVLNEIDYVTIASTGNATDFGDVTVARRGGGPISSGSNSIRGYAAGGLAPSVSNVIDYVTIATTGDAADFGDLATASNASMGFSDSHGGLQ